MAVTRRPLLAVVLALVGGTAIAACGGSSPGRSGGPSGGSGAMLALSHCMRAHGVTNFPDPGATGRGINLDGTGINPAAPAFRAAQAICFRELPGGGPNGHRLSRQEVAAMVATSECMRAHGVTRFPDPYAVPLGSAPPNLNPTDYGSVELRGGEVLAIPRSIDENAPVFQRASKACDF